ncbi:hypothetical protein [Amycolatopsis taiwanensis]|uniref:hypothetical protein n=1 Tax=Amycolatopsis taiwanensis TaxID=342230 RepID=UPI0012EB6599|nr:hypothetical protein [Amycolatopsis taiwanensis]
MTTRTPYDALDSLLAMAASGDLGALCARHGVELLVAHGSVVDPEPLRPPRDLDLAFRTRHDVEPDLLDLTNDLLDATRFDGLDLMNLNRAGVVARAHALSPQSRVLYEAARGIFATAQMAAITMAMETRRLRLLDLELMAER